jgi:hypothetical protein
MLKSEPWPLLPPFPLLLRFSVQPIVKLTAELFASLSAALFACTLLHDLTLISIIFDETATEEQCQLRWAEILRGVPNLRRLRITYGISFHCSLCCLRTCRCWSIWRC